MSRYAIIAAPCLLGLLWVADQVAGTGWALPFGIAVVAVPVAADRHGRRNAR